MPTALTAIQLSHNSLAVLEDDPEVAATRCWRASCRWSRLRAAVLDMEVRSSLPRCARPFLHAGHSDGEQRRSSPPDVRGDTPCLRFVAVCPERARLDQMREFLEAAFAEAKHCRRPAPTAWASRGCSRRWPGCRSGRRRTGISILSVRKDSSEPSGDQPEEPGAAPGPRSNKE